MTEAEESIRSAWELGDFARATTDMLCYYGPEVLGFLAAVHHDESAAEEAFSVFAENLWRGIAHFEWKCSVRTWLYAVARNASLDVRRGAARRRRLVSTSDGPISEIPAAVRTATVSILRTEARNAFARLRDELPEEDRTLLVLRVDRNLPWFDIARVFGAHSEPDLKREAARLRKRFQFVKQRLRVLAHERGLV
jgi:RNA polymerase sigma-70 factor (ECF subfamily)